MRNRNDDVYVENLGTKDMLKLGPSHPKVRSTMDIKMENEKKKWMKNFSTERSEQPH